MTLSEEQLSAVHHMDGPAMCIAGPGSGKTAVIVNRVNNLIKNGVKPGEILVVTFAKAAARSMEERFFSMTGIAGVRFSTIHSLCYHLINQGNETGLSLLPDKVKRGFIKNTFDIRKGHQAALTDRQYNDISMEISRFKSVNEDYNDRGKEKISMKDYDPHFMQSKEDFVFIYGKYREFQKYNSYYDFDDMTCLALDKLKTGKYRLCFRYLLADEFQDTSPAQLRLLSSVADCSNLFAVGDDDQSIYGFRGASPAILKLFREIYPECRIFYLKNNYRCNEKITEAANTLIKENKERFPKRIISRYTSPEDDSGIFIETYETEYDELKAVRAYLLSEDHKKDKSFAVLTRTNHEAQLVCCMLDRAGISYNCALKNKDPFDNPYVNVILSYMRLSLGRGGLSDLINVMKIQDPPVPQRVVSSCFSGDTASAFRRLKGYALYDESMLYMLKQLEGRLELMRGMPPDMQLMFIRKSCGADMYFKNICDKNGASYDSLEVQVDTFGEYVKDFSTAESLVRFQSETRQDIFADINKGSSSNINVLTLHASKGLEYDSVWIINVNDGIIPYKKAVDMGMAEEERRLFYVGMTRARDRLVISCHKSVGSKKSTESGFLKCLKNLR